MSFPVRGGLVRHPGIIYKPAGSYPLFTDYSLSLYLPDRTEKEPEPSLVIPFLNYHAYNYLHCRFLLRLCWFFLERKHMTVFFFHFSAYKLHGFFFATCYASLYFNPWLFIFENWITRFRVVIFYMQAMQIVFN